MHPDRYFVLGNPVAHSHSPFIHAAFAAQTGQHLHYDRRLCPLEGFAAAVRALAADTDGGPVRGCNVTVPFKHEALRLATWATERARLAGAANVLSFDDGQWRADNTDGAGLMRDLQQDAACPMEQQHVLLVGAGGAAAGVLGPLLNCRPARVVVANRTLERAQALVEAHAGLAAAQGVANFGVTLKDQRTHIAPRQGDGCGATSRTGANDYRICSTHSRNGNTRWTRAPERPASSRMERHSAGRNARAMDNCPSWRTMGCHRMIRAKRG